VLELLDKLPEVKENLSDRCSVKSIITDHNWENKGNNDNIVKLEDQLVEIKKNLHKIDPLDVLSSDIFSSLSDPSSQNSSCSNT
jgi:hypothetical protein